MKFIIDGRLDIRPLNIQDKSHIALPYDQVDFSPSLAFTIADDAQSSDLYNDSDWGSGLTFYFEAIVLFLYAAADFNDDATEGVFLRIADINGNFIQEMITDRPINLGGAFAYAVEKTYTVAPVLITTQLVIEIVNRSGENFTGVNYRVFGVAI